MLLDALICPNCGASLPSQPAGSVITCQYCNTSFRVPASLTPEPDLGDLMLGADFSRKPVVGWDFPNEDSIRLPGGTPPELRAQFAASDTLYYVLNSTGYFDNVDVSVTVRFYGGELKYIDGGLSVRYQKGVGSYAFLLSPLGTYQIGYYAPGTDGSMSFHAIVEWTAHSAIRTGLDQPNRLRVTANGDQLRVYLNGVLATSLHDARYQSGEIMVDLEGSPKSGVEAGFSDLQVRDIKKQ